MKALFATSMLLTLIFSVYCFIKGHYTDNAVLLDISGYTALLAVIYLLAALILDWKERYQHAQDLIKQYREG